MGNYCRQKSGGGTEREGEKGLQQEGEGRGATFLHRWRLLLPPPTLRYNIGHTADKKYFFPYTIAHPRLFPRIFLIRCYRKRLLLAKLERILE